MQAMQTIDPKPRPAPRQRGFLARLAARRDGGTAVEFALVSIPFLALLFAIIETGLMFFVSQMLDGAASVAARDIRTGQAQKVNMSHDEMRALICQGMVSLVGCPDNLYLDVRSYSSFNAVTLGSPLDGDGKFTNLQYSLGNSSDVVVIRAYYTWPSFFHLLPTASSLPDGKRLLSAVLAFRNEPFPW
jgi:Flp pilus assembly protein TadG